MNDVPHGCPVVTAGDWPFVVLSGLKYPVTVWGITGDVLAADAPVPAPVLAEAGPAAMAVLATVAAATPSTASSFDRFVMILRLLEQVGFLWSGVE